MVNESQVARNKHAVTIIIQAYVANGIKISFFFFLKKKNKNKNKTKHDV